MSGKWGMIAGAMQGAQRASEIWLTAEMEKQKQERMQQFANDSYARQRADQLADKEADREYQKGILADDRAYKDKVRAEDYANQKELAKAKGKNELDARLKYKLDDLSSQREQLMKLRESEVISPEERADITDQINSINDSMQNLLYGQEKQFDFDRALERLNGANDADVKSSIEMIRKSNGDQVADELLKRLANGKAEQDSKVANSNPPEKRKAPGVLNNDIVQDSSGILSNKELQPHQQVIMPQGKTNLQELSEAISTNPNNAMTKQDLGSKKAFESKAAVGRFMAKYASGKRTPTFGEVKEALNYLSSMTEQEQKLVIAYANKFGIKP